VRLGFDASVERQAPNAGTARYARELLSHMARGTPEGDVLVALDGWPRWRTESELARPFRRAVNLASDVGWLTAGSLARAARHGLDAWFGPANAAPWILPRPVVVTIHDVNLLSVPQAYDAGFVRYASRGMRIAAKRARLVITSTDWTRHQISDRLGIEAARVRTVYPGLDHLPTTAGLPSSLGVPRPYALFVGQTEPHKNVKLLIEAWRAGVPGDLHLVVAGTPGRDHDRLTDLTDRARLSDRVHFTGLLDDATIAALYADAQMFLFPSLAEGFGFPPLEAMARGVPTAVSDIPVLAEVTRGAARLFDPHNAQALAGLIGELHDDPDLRGRLSKSGRSVADGYRWASAAAEVWQAVHRAVGG
jgi:alpha-1,3-rhamnosyl/mannosyltransferase